MDQVFERHRILLSRLFVAGMLALIAVSGSHWSEGHEVVGDGLMALGLILIGIATVGRLWCNLYIVGYKNQTLLTAGPYSISRNPLYFFSALGGIGVGLATETLFFGALIALIFALTYPGVIRTEERRLAKLHGRRWSEYVQTVPRFFPRFGRLTEPTDYTVHPRLFRRHLLDALWFVWAAGLMELLGGMRAAGWLPTYFAPL